MISLFYTFLVLVANLWIGPECLYSSEIIECVLLFLLFLHISDDREQKSSRYGLKCVPTNSYVEARALSSLEFDCIWRQGPKEVMKLMGGLREGPNLI